MKTRGYTSNVCNKKKSKIWLRCILPENGRSLGSLSFKSLILVKKQEPEQASKCPVVGEYPKNRNNVYLNEATIVTSWVKKYLSTHALD